MRKKMIMVVFAFVFTFVFCKTVAAADINQDLKADSDIIKMPQEGISNTTESSDVDLRTISDATVERIAGENRIGTACKIAEKWGQSDVVILTRSDLFADALSGVPLAAKLEAPILLTEPNNLNPKTLQTMQALGSRVVIILGSEKAISKSIENSLKQAYQVERIGGANRYETSALIAKKLKEDYGVTKIILSTGENFPDALAAAPYANKQNAAILLVHPKILGEETKDALKEMGVAQLIIIGSEVAVCWEVENELNQMGISTTRICGNDRYETAVKIAEKINATNLIIATGENFPDALAGGAFAIKKNALILLVKRNEVPSVVYDYLAINKERFNNVWILGGEVAISNEVEAQITGSKPPTNSIDPPANPVRLIFIHHSTGENWLADDNGRLGIALRDNNYYVSDTNYGWGPDSIGDRTDIGHWWEWFRGSKSSTYLNALYTEDGQHSSYSRMSTNPGGENEIIMFKSCFPNSALQGNSNDPVPPIGSNPLRGQDCGSEYHTVANAKGIYIDLLEYFKSRQDKLFIVITAPPLSDPTYADNARAFNQWLVNDWLRDYPYDNVFVFDFYNVLTTNGGNPNINDLNQETGNHHRWWNDNIQHKTDGDNDGNPNVLEYPSSSGDDHPNVAGNLKATGEFVKLLNYAYHRCKS